MIQIFKFSALVVLTASLLVGCGGITSSRSRNSQVQVTTTIPYNPWPTTTTTTIPFPPLEATCSIQANNSSSSVPVTPGSSVNFTVTVSGGALTSVFNFGNLTSGSISQLLQKPNASSRNASASLSFSLLGSHRVTATVIDSSTSRTFTCGLDVNVQRVALIIEGTRSAAPLRTIHLVPRVIGMAEGFNYLYSLENSQGALVTGGFAYTLDANGFHITELNNEENTGLVFLVQAQNRSSGNIIAEVRTPIAFVHPLQCRILGQYTARFGVETNFQIVAVDSYGNPTGEILRMEEPTIQGSAIVVNRAGNIVTIKFTNPYAGLYSFPNNNTLSFRATSLRPGLVGRICTEPNIRVTAIP